MPAIKSEQRAKSDLFKSLRAMRAWRIFEVEKS